MKKAFLILFLFGSLTINFSCSKDDNNSADPIEATTFLNVSYGDNSLQKYDLYLPYDRSAEKTKVIVLVHGGGWTGGDKSDMNGFISAIQQKHPNHAIVNVNYVLADANTPAFPNQYLDLHAVVNKISNEKNQLYIRPEFALIGLSAGAHIAMMYDYAYDADDKVKMVANIVGPTDFTDPFYSDDPGFLFLMAALVDESAYPPGTNYAEVNSPAFRVSHTSSPTLLFYGNSDPLVPVSNAHTLNAALNNFEIDHSLTIYNGGHGNWAPDDLQNTMLQISEYVNTYLKIEE